MDAGGPGLGREGEARMMGQPNSRRPRRGENPKPTAEPPARYTALLLEALIASKGSAVRAQQ